MTELKWSSPAEQTELEAFHKVYKKLKNVILQWQMERGKYWSQSLVPDEKYPYFKLSSLPEEPILELVNFLLEASNRRYTKEELHSSWSLYRLEQRLENQELFSYFTLAVQGVLKLARRDLPESLRQTAASQGGQRCPICGQEASLSVLVPPVGKRVLHCTRCDHEWQGRRVGCIHCGSEEASQQTYFKNENFAGVEIVVCQACAGDFKEVDLRERAVEDWTWEDIRTLPLNYAAEKWLHEQAEKKDLLL